MDEKTARFTVESELAFALARLSYGRVSLAEAREIAKEYAPILENHPTALEHKSIGYYAKEILAKS